MECKYCKSTEMRREVKGPHLGVYCVNCGKWQKWEQHTDNSKTPDQYKEEYLIKETATREQIGLIKYLLMKEINKSQASKIIEILKQEAV